MSCQLVGAFPESTRFGWVCCFLGSRLFFFLLVKSGLNSSVFLCHVPEFLLEFCYGYVLCSFLQIFLSSVIFYDSSDFLCFSFIFWIFLGFWGSWFPPSVLKIFHSL